MVDIDELDRLHAALPELFGRGESDAWSPTAFAVIAEAPISANRRLDGPVTMGEVAVAAVTILRAYPALAAEVRALRAKEADALFALATVADLISGNGCDCECGHHYEEHDDDCERCLACRVDACFTRPIRDAIHEVPR